MIVGGGGGGLLVENASNRETNMMVGSDLNRRPKAGLGTKATLIIYGELVKNAVINARKKFSFFSHS